MTSINIPRDDAANLIDTKAVRNQTVKEVSAYPTTQPVTAHDDVTQTPPPPPRRQQQRRREERRKQNLPVLLDTRSGHDRRNAAREDDIKLEGDTEQPTRTGIDVYS